MIHLMGMEKQVTMRMLCNSITVTFLLWKISRRVEAQHQMWITITDYSSK
jgi:hypothetical protein